MARRSGQSAGSGDAHLINVAFGVHDDDPRWGAGSSPTRWSGRGSAPERTGSRACVNWPELSVLLAGRAAKVALLNRRFTTTWCNACSPIRAKPVMAGRHRAPLARASCINARSRTSSRTARGNAAMKSFFSLLQEDVLNRQRWQTRSQLRTEISYWIEAKYRPRRRQRALGKQTPIEFETLNKSANAA